MAFAIGVFERRCIRNACTCKVSGAAGAGAYCYTARLLSAVSATPQATWQDAASIRARREGVDRHCNLCH
jgi:hypothetical protein